MQNGKVICYTS
ncbi:hypothetical protein MTR67_048415 [Solanum verrucosum]|uniref:Uncharacterized protein n=1 Tax=Solanum verrucosum TaxID=315347 RepID=A0AAF0UYC7_SOLVR|nr:hypothetical protein MTR67_048415 [Solanum verrucosum]